MLGDSYAVGAALSARSSEQSCRPVQASAPRCCCYQSPERRLYKYEMATCHETPEDLRELQGGLREDVEKYKV